MWETLLVTLVGTATTALFGLWAAAKVFLPKVMEILTKRIEHSQNQEIKHLEARLQLHTTALINSLEIASRIGESYRNRTIESIDKLWKDIVHVEKAFAPLVAVVTLLTETELNAATSNPASNNEEVRPILEEYSSFHKVVQKMSPKARK